MPGLNAVLRAWHLMLGRDLHIPWPPGSPSPAPAPVPYTTTAVMAGIIPMATSKMTTSAFADSMSPMMVRGTDIGPLIPHVGPPSLTLPIEMITSGSKSHFGVTKWKVKDQTGAEGCVAVGVLGLTNLNLNCGTPAPTPFGLVIAPTTHLATLTLGDLISGLYMMAWDYMLQRIMYAFGNALGEWVFPRVAYIAERLGVGALGRTAARQMARALGRRANIGPLARALQAQRIKALAAVAEKTTIALGLAAGSPLGISTSTIGAVTGDDTTKSAYDHFSDLTDPQGNADDLGQSVDDYFASPSPSVTDVPSVPEDDTAGDAGVPDSTTSSDAAGPTSVDQGDGTNTSSVDPGDGTNTSSVDPGDGTNTSSVDPGDGTNTSSVDQGDGTNTSSVDPGDAGSSSTQSTPQTSSTASDVSPGTSTSTTPTSTTDPSSETSTADEQSSSTPQSGSDDADGNSSR
jgi:hypothetical protein